MKIKEYNQMMAYLTRPSTPLERKISDANVDEDIELVGALNAQYQIIDAQYKEQIQTLQGVL